MSYVNIKYRRWQRLFTQEIAYDKLKESCVTYNSPKNRNFSSAVTIAGYANAGGVLFIQTAMSQQQKIVYQLLGGRCEGETFRFKLILKRIARKIYQTPWSDLNLENYKGKVSSSFARSASEYKSVFEKI